MENSDGRGIDELLNRITRGCLHIIDDIRIMAIVDLLQSIGEDEFSLTPTSVYGIGEIIESLNKEFQETAKRMLEDVRQLGNRMATGGTAQ